MSTFIILLISLQFFYATISYMAKKNSSFHFSTPHWLFFAPFLFLFCSELIQQPSIGTTFNQIFHNWPYFLLAYLVIFFFYTFLLLLSNNFLLTTIIFSLVTFAISLSNYFKVLYRGEFFNFSDLTLWREAFFIGNSYQIYLFPQALLALVLLVLFIILIIRFPPKKIRPYFSLARFIFLAILFLIAFISQRTFFLNLKQTFAALHLDYHFREQTWDTENKHGFLPTLIIETFSDTINRPRNYSQKTINNLLQAYSLDQYSSTLASTSASLKPNVIVVMNESFVDFDRFNSLRFEQPLTPTFDHLQTQFDHGYLLVKTYGGGTAETEFEVLTGMSTSFHPLTSIAYNRYLSHPLPALPYLFAQNGYQTIAIHPNEPWFFNRNQAYPYLGFQQFHSLSDFELPLTIRGSDKTDVINNVGFVADSDVTKKIISLTQENPTQPKFIFAITIENHGWYQDKVFPASDYQQVDYSFTVASTSATINPADKQVFANYLIGVKDADVMLHDLITYYQNQTQPTIIVFFGDHFPGLDHQFMQNITSDHTETWRTPFLIWKNSTANTLTNFTEATQAAAIAGTNFDTISAFHLAPLILKTSQQSLPSTFQFLEHLRSQLPAYNTQFNLLPSGETITNNALSPNLQELKNQHWLWQYDFLFGQQFGF